MKKQFIKDTLFDATFNDWERIEVIYKEHNKSIRRNDRRWFGVILLISIIFIGFLNQKEVDNNYKFDSFKAERNVMDSIYRDTIAKSIYKNAGYVIDTLGMATYVKNHQR